MPFLLLKLQVFIGFHCTGCVGLFAWVLSSTRGVTVFIQLNHLDSVARVEIQGQKKRALILTDEAPPSVWMSWDDDLSLSLNPHHSFKLSEFNDSMRHALRYNSGDFLCFGHLIPALSEGRKRSACQQIYGLPHKTPISAVCCPKSAVKNNRIG